MEQEEEEDVQEQEEEEERGRLAYGWLSDFMLLPVRRFRGWCRSSLKPRRLALRVVEVAVVLPTAGVAHRSHR
jgi:hypothetical protein